MDAFTAVVNVSEAPRDQEFGHLRGGFSYGCVVANTTEVEAPKDAEFGHLRGGFSYGCTIA